MEDADEEVGRRVRRMMEEISGNRPEELQSAEDIKVVCQKLKSTQREFRKLDENRGQPVMGEAASEAKSEPER